MHCLDTLLTIKSVVAESERLQSQRRLDFICMVFGNGSEVEMFSVLECF